MELKIDEGGPVSVVQVSGELDAEQFMDALHDLVSQEAPKLAIDLSAMATIDSQGLSSLVGLVNSARLREGDVVLVAPTSFVAGVLNVTRLDAWVTICPTLDEAIQHLS